MDFYERDTVMDIVEINVTLEDIKPAVTRTLQVPMNIRLDRLHLVLQAAMGWTNSHLYLFDVAGTTWGMPDIEFADDDLPANKTTLAEALDDADVQSIRYLYDFGDSWEHRLKIGKVISPDPGHIYPRLTNIAGRCPPEDVGGFPGYEHFLQVMADSSDPEHDGLKTWCGGSFDPNTPPVDELRFEVLKLAKRWKPKRR